MPVLAEAGEHTVHRYAHPVRVRGQPGNEQGLSQPDLSLVTTRRRPRRPSHRATESSTSPAAGKIANPDHRTTNTGTSAGPPNYRTTDLPTYRPPELPSCRRCREVRPDVLKRCSHAYLSRFDRMIAAMVGDAAAVWAAAAGPGEAVMIALRQTSDGWQTAAVRSTEFVVSGLFRQACRSRQRPCVLWCVDRLRSFVLDLTSSYFRRSIGPRATT
jgi:hypothetical protein